MPSKHSRAVTSKKDSDESRADETDDSEPDTVLYSDDSSTADTEDDISDAEPGLATDWAAAGAGQGYRHWLRASVPNIHRGPQQNSLHVTFNRYARGENMYKLQVSYEKLYRVKEFVQALSDVAHLFAADPSRRWLSIAKTFNNPRRGLANVFLYFVQSAPVHILMGMVWKLRTHFKVGAGRVLLKDNFADARTLAWL